MTKYYFAIILVSKCKSCFLKQSICFTMSTASASARQRGRRHEHSALSAKCGHSVQNLILVKHYDRLRSAFGAVQRACRFRH